VTESAAHFKATKGDQSSTPPKAIDAARPLTIVVITRNTKGLVENLLASITPDESLCRLLDCIIIVDNGSTDGTDEIVEGTALPLRYLRQDRNLGFAAAANKGLSLATSPYVFFLNSDTQLIPGHTERLIAYMEDHHATAVCGPQLIYPDNSPQRSYALVPSIFFEIVPPSVLGLLLPGRYAVRPGRPGKPHAVASLIGAAIMVRREVIERLGGFDERFFFFLEETDLCVRARREGYAVAFFADASVIHMQGKTVASRWVDGRIEYNISLRKFIEKHHGRAYSALFSALRFTKGALYLLVVTLLPLLLLQERTRRRYRYYLRLLHWHLGGSRDDGGLQSNSREQKSLRG
jgi:N-acetylglucosaminyl-diphospho-decaprenol L-rhamnosyltransferase